MIKAGTQTGSFLNHVMSGDTTEPKVGDGATILGWTDRKAGTVVKVTPTQVHVQRDTATRTDNNGMSENQQYTYAANNSGQVHVFRKTKRGWHSNTAAGGLLIGSRQEFYDYAF